MYHRINYEERGPGIRLVKCTDEFENFAGEFARSNRG